MLRAIVGLLDNSVHIDSFVPWPDAYTASNKRARNRSSHTRQDSLCTYTVEDFEFLDILVHIYVHIMTIHKHNNDSTHCECTVKQESLAGGQFGKIGESSMIHQTKTIQINTYY